MSSEPGWLRSSYGASGDAQSLLALARELEANGELRAAATAYDRAHGLNPENVDAKEARWSLLNRLAVTEHGITFRYIPAGAFLMGSEGGDPDERPVHPVEIDQYWLSETPISWSTCELSGEAPREDPSQPLRYGLKPMVSVSWQDARMLCARISDATTAYRLPTEAEWEKAARGGLINRIYPWGDEPPTASCCDFDRLDQLSILPMRRLPPNGYGLRAMAGGVWEWTSDRYDAVYYQKSPFRNPAGSSAGEERVLRGGSWADCAEAVRVSFRMSRKSKPPWPHLTPNIGFRLCRVQAAMNSDST